MLNDTCPSEKMCYLIIYTGKNLSFVHGMNGSDMLSRTDQKRLSEYQESIQKCRLLAKSLGGQLSAYTRPNYNYDIGPIVKCYKNRPKKIPKPTIRAK